MLDPNAFPQLFDLHRSMLESFPPYLQQHPRIHTATYPGPPHPSFATAVFCPETNVADITGGGIAEGVRVRIDGLRRWLQIIRLHC